MNKSIKIIGWNVNGFNSITQKGQLQKLILDQKPDILCLQELKCEQNKCQKIFKEQFPDTKYKFYNFSAQKAGYAGVGIMTLYEPQSIQYGIPESFGKSLQEKEDIINFNNEGRLIKITFKSFTLINVYVPNSQPELKRLQFRLRYEQIFKNYINSLKLKNLIITFDANVAHQEIDIARPDQNKRNAGFTNEEREAFTTLLNESGMINAFRHFNPETVKYTYWTYMGSARKRNIGWHIDYFLITPYFIKNKKVKRSDILDTQVGSDHAPIILQLQNLKIS